MRRDFTGDTTWNVRPEKPTTVGPSTLEHGLDPDYIEEMWRSEDVEEFEVERHPPRETNTIAIRFVRQSDGTLEMIAEDEGQRYFIFPRCSPNRIEARRGPRICDTPRSNAAGRHAGCGNRAAAPLHHAINLVSIRRQHKILFENTLSIC